MRGVIAIFTDLTEAKRLEAKVRAADRLAAVGELSASIAHEIRNPLAAIAGSVEVLKDDLHVTGENARLMDLITKESERLSRITTDFLQYARIIQPAFEKVELCHLINEVVQVVRHQAASAEGTRVDWETDASIVYVVGDENLIKQLLINLMVNAVEAVSNHRGLVGISLQAESDDRIVVTVTDDGPGIEPPDLKYIYDPFFSTKKAGTGLGLAIVHRVATALSLGLTVETEPERGTTFTVTFARFAGGCQNGAGPSVNSNHTIAETTNS
jgi:signal transduction histidine kinase